MADLGDLVLRLRLNDDQYTRGIANAKRLAESIRDINVDVNFRSDDSLKRFQRQVNALQKERINIPVNVDTKAINNALGNAGRVGAQNYGSGFNSVSQGIFQGVGQSITGILVNAVQSAGRLAADALTGFFGGAIAEFTKFDQAVTNFNAKAGNITPDQLNAFAEEARNLAAQTAFVPAQVADLGTQLLALGVSVDDVSDRLGGITKLADVLGEDPVITGRVVQGGLAAYEQFGVTTDELTNKLNKLITTTAAGGRSGIAEFEQLFSKAAGPAAELGVTIDDLTASFAAIRQTGATARVAATGIRNALTTIASDTDKLRAAGIETVFDSTGALDFEATVRNIGASLEGLTQTERIARLDELFGAGAGPGILALISQIDTSFKSAKASVEDFEGSVDASLEIANQSLQRQRELLGGNFASFLVDVGASLEGALAGIVGALNQILSSLSGQDLGLDSLTAAGEKFNEVILNSPEIIDGIAQGLADVIKFFNQLIQGTIEFGTKFLQNQNAVDSVGRAVTSIGDRFGTIIPLVIDLASELGNALSNFFEITELGNTFFDIFDGTTAVIAFVIDRITALVSILNSALEILGSANNFVSDLSNGFLDLSNVAQTIVNILFPLPGLIGTVYGLVRDIVGEAERLDEIVSNLGPNLETGLVGAAEALGEVSLPETVGPTLGDRDRGQAEEDALDVLDSEELFKDRQRETERAFQEQLRNESQAFEDAERAKKLAFEDEIEARKLRTEQQVNSLREQLQAREEQHNKRQEDIKNQAQANRQALEEQFNKQQQQAEEEFTRQQNEEARAFNEELNREEQAALQALDREQQLADAESPRERRELEEQFAAEDELAAKRQEIEDEFEQRRRAFEEQQRQEQAAFEAQQEAEKLAFEQQLLELERQTQAELEANERAFLAEKQAIEAQIDATKKASEQEIIELKRAFEDAERERKRAFEDEERAKKQAFEDAERERERAFNQEERDADAELIAEGISAERQKQQIAEEIRQGERELLEAKRRDREEQQRLLADLERVARNAQGISGGAASALSAGITAFRTGGTVAPGQVGLAGEAGPELFKFRSGETGLFTQPTLFQAPSMGRIYSAPKTSRKMSGKIQNEGVSREIKQMNKLMKQVLAKPSGQVQTNVNLDGANPEQVRRELARMQLNLYQSMARL